MARKYTLNEKMKKAREMAEFLSDLITEEKEEKEEFVNKEIAPHAPKLMSFGEHLRPQDNVHETLGYNVHPLSCGRCGRMTPIAVPLGKYNAIWKCDACHIEQYGVEDEFHKCPNCKALMVQTKTFQKNEPVSFDYLCKTCREHGDAQTKIATAGGALVVCPRCSTSGTLPATDKQVVKFRKEHELGNTVEVRFLLLETQCPRCADNALQRTFTTGEEKRILLHDSDVEQGFHKAPSAKESVEKSKEVKKRGKKSKGSEKPADVVGDFGPAEDEVRLTGKEILVPHPGTKTYN